jgi:hypothetical protein
MQNILKALNWFITESEYILSFSFRVKQKNDEQLNCYTIDRQ